MQKQKAISRLPENLCLCIMPKYDNGSTINLPVKSLVNPYFLLLSSHFLHATIKTNVVPIINIYFKNLENNLQFSPR